MKHFGSRSGEAYRIDLSEEELGDLVETVDNLVKNSGCDHTHRYTKEFLTKAGKDVDVVLGGLMGLGGFCDCEVAMNVEPWEVYP